MATSSSASQRVVEEERTVSIDIVETVGAAADSPVEELPPLYDAIDPDAVNALFAPDRGDVRIEFRYAGYHVTVREDRSINVSRLG